MSGSFPPLPELRPFQAPNLVAMSGAMQEQSLNAMREGQLMGDEREKNALRALFADPNFNPADPAQGRRVLEAAPRSGHATYSALLRGYADQRAAEASVRAAAASDRAAALSARQAQAADLDRSIKLTQSFRDMLPTANAENYPTIRAAALAAVPSWAPSWPETYDANAVRALMQKADDSLREHAERNKPAADFTLSPGQTRFNAAGQPITTAPERPAREGFTLSPGQTRFDAAGQPITTAPERPVRDPAREIKIEDIMRTFGVDRRTAVGIESGVLRPIADPVTGQTRLIDLTNNTFRETTPAAPAPAPAPAPPAPAPLVTGSRAGLNPPPVEPAPAAPAPSPAAEAPPAPNQTLYQLAQRPRTTGLTPLALQGGQSVLGQFGANIIDPELTERRQTFSTTQGDLIRALSINPRYPVDEMKRIREEISIEPRAFTDPQSLLARMRSVGRSLRTRLADEERAGADPLLPADDRRAALRAAEDIRNFLAKLGAPEDQSPTAAPPPRRNALNRRTQTGAPQRLRYNPETGALEPAQ
jgi:hypothetical protein